MAMNVNLTRETSEYLNVAGATKDERLQILGWIKDGNSIYDNPWHMADDEGRSMDYISALRAVGELRAGH